MATFVAGWLSLQKDGFTPTSFEDRRRTDSFDEEDEEAIKDLLHAPCPEIAEGM